MNVTPLVDVALVLLIIFMAAAPTLQRTYDVTVPPKATGPVTADADQIVISQNKRDTVWLNQEEIEIAAMPERLQNILTHRLNKQVFYSGDSMLNYQTALVTIDLLNRAGASVGIVTR